LGARGGRGVTLELATNVDGPAGREAGTPGWSGVRVVRAYERARQSAAPDRPNVLVLLVDTLRADHLGCYGAGPSPSPNLDRLAERGLLFEQAIAQAPWTTPSVATILTGLPPLGRAEPRAPLPRLPPLHGRPRAVLAPRRVPAAGARWRTLRRRARAARGHRRASQLVGRAAARRRRGAAPPQPLRRRHPLLGLRAAATPRRAHGARRARLDHRRRDRRPRRGGPGARQADARPRPLRRAAARDAQRRGARRGARPR